MRLTKAPARVPTPPGWPAVHGAAISRGAERRADQILRVCDNDDGFASADDDEAFVVSGDEIDDLAPPVAGNRGSMGLPVQKRLHRSLRCASVTRRWCGAAAPADSPDNPP